VHPIVLSGFEYQFLPFASDDNEPTDYANILVTYEEPQPPTSILNLHYGALSGDNIAGLIAQGKAHQSAGPLDLRKLHLLSGSATF